MDESLSAESEKQLTPGKQIGLPKEPYCVLISLSFYVLMQQDEPLWIRASRRGSLLLLALFAIIIFMDASICNKSVKIGGLSVIAAFIQLTGYGSGFLRAWWKRCICGGKSFSAFEKTFYK